MFFMSEIIWGLGILVSIFCLIILMSIFRFLTARKKKRYLLSGKFYKKVPLMNYSELQFFKFFSSTFPNWYLFPQIPFSCIVQPKTKKSESFQKQLWKINQKRVDFLVCDKKFNSLFIVEIDGASHRYKKQQDKDRDVFFEECQLPTLRLSIDDVQSLNIEELKRRVGHLNLR